MSPKLVLKKLLFSIYPKLVSLLLSKTLFLKTHCEPFYVFVNKKLLQCSFVICSLGEATKQLLSVPSVVDLQLDQTLVTSQLYAVFRPNY